MLRNADIPPLNYQDFSFSFYCCPLLPSAKPEREPDGRLPWHSDGYFPPPSVYNWKVSQQMSEPLVLFLTGQSVYTEMFVFCNVSGEKNVQFKSPSCWPPHSYSWQCSQHCPGRPAGPRLSGECDSPAHWQSSYVSGPGSQHTRPCTTLSGDWVYRRQCR